MVIGVDKGTTYTKDSNLNIFKSTVRRYSKDEIILDKNKLVVEFNGEKYIIGETGEYATDLLKAGHEHTQMLVLTAIANSSTDEILTTNLVTGLPIGLYSKQKVPMKFLFENTRNRLNINGKEKIIYINKVEVFPEAAGAFYSQSKYNTGLVLDIGGLSIDTAYFEGEKLKKYSTYSHGIMKLYSKIANRLNAEYDLSLTEWDIEGIIKKGLYIFGEKVELNIDDLVIEHSNQIIERLKLEYDLKTVPVVLFTGGGSYLLSKYMMNNIPQQQAIDNAQFNNAIGYKAIGEVLFK